MPALDEISRALDRAAVERDRLERGAADLAERTAARLDDVQAAIAGVNETHQHLRIAIEDERARLEHLEIDASRYDIEAASESRQAERLAPRIEQQERLAGAVEADLQRIRESVRAARDARDAGRAHADADRATRAMRLDAARRDLAHASALHAAALAELEGLVPPDTERDLAEIATRRGHVEAELAAARARREAIPSQGGASTLAERTWQDQRARVDAEIGQLATERAALDRAEAEVRQAVVDHQARATGLAREVDELRARVDAAHERFPLLVRAGEVDEERALRAAAEADAAVARLAATEDELAIAYRGERERLDPLLDELLRYEAAAREATARARALRAERAEERTLRTLMADLASLELALGDAIAERDELERLLGRMRAGAI